MLKNINIYKATFQKFAAFLFDVKYFLFSI